MGHTAATRICTVIRHSPVTCSQIQTGPNGWPQQWPEEKLKHFGPEKVNLLWKLDILSCLWSCMMGTLVYLR